MRRASLSLTLPSLAMVLGAAAACGDLPDPTNVVDLRVLGVKAEPAGFLVDRANPSGAADAELSAKVTALVVDPRGAGQEVTFTAAGCPDYIDTITAATGTSSKLCPSPDATAQIPEPIGSALRTQILDPGRTGPVVQGGFQYEPFVDFGLTSRQVGLFFSPTPTGVEAIDASVALNRDFGLAAIVNMSFALGAEQVTIIKRVVYWPRLDDQEVPNHNPELMAIEFYKERDAVTGQPQTLWEGDPPMLSLSMGHKLFVKPVPMPGAAEPYDLNVRNSQTDMIEKRHFDRELLTYQFFATRGTFAPSERTSETPPFLTTEDGMVHTDSEWQPPKKTEIGDGGEQVTIWIVVRDERAGVSWSSRTFNVAP